LLCVSPFTLTAAALIATAVGQITRLAPPLWGFILVVSPVVVFLGIVTFVRLLERSELRRLRGAELPSAKEARARSRRKWHVLGGEPQTDQLFDHEIVERMGGRLLSRALCSRDSTHARGRSVVRVDPRPNQAAVEAGSVTLAAGMLACLLRGYLYGT
jgi:hypothetical protein